MKDIKFIMIILSWLLFYPAFAFGSSGALNVIQTELENSLSCDKIEGKSSICLVSTLWHPTPEAYIFKFRVRGNFEAKEVEENTVMYARLMSTYFNPLTASFYGTEPALKDMLDESKFKSENIIVEIELSNNKSYYSAYFYPRIVNGKINLIHNFFVGKLDVYEHLKNVCDEMKEISESTIYLQRCTFYNIKTLEPATLSP